MTSSLLARAKQAAPAGAEPPQVVLELEAHWEMSADHARFRPCPVIRLGPARAVEDEDDRQWKGWHEHLAATDPDAQLAAIDRWWPIADPTDGHLYLFTVSSFVVYAARSHGVTTRLGLRHLHLQPEPDPRYSHVRLPTGPGGNLVPLQARPSHD